MRRLLIYPLIYPRPGDSGDVDPLLVLTGEEYEKATFDELRTRICDALRGSRPAVMMETWGADGSVRLIMRDGSSRLLSPEEVKSLGTDDAGVATASPRLVAFSRLA